MSTAESDSVDTEKRPDSPYLDAIDSPDDLNSLDDGDPSQDAATINDGEDNTDGSEKLHDAEKETVDSSTVDSSTVASSTADTGAAESVEERMEVDETQASESEPDKPPADTDADKPTNNIEPESSEETTGEQTATAEETNEPREELSNNNGVEEAAEDPVEPMEVDESDGGASKKSSAVTSDENTHAECTEERNESEEQNGSDAPNEPNESAERNEGGEPDDSVMEHDPEKVNCSDLSEPTENEKTVADDPFEALKSSTVNNADTTTTSTSSAAKESLNTSTNSDDAEPDDGVGNETNDVNDNDNGDHDENDESEVNETANESHIEAEFEMSDGRGADEEVCLLPDEEREISDADKERAILAKEAAEKEHDEGDGDNENENENDPELEQDQEPDGEVAADENEVGEKDTSEQQAIAEEQENEATTNDQPADVSLHLANKEIREINVNLLPEKMCIECGTTTKCKYTMLLQPETFGADETAGADEATAGEVQYLCDTDCMKQFHMKNESYHVTVRKVSIGFTIDSVQKCFHCNEQKTCKYRFKSNASPEYEYLCEDECLDKLRETHPEKYQVNKKRFFIDDVAGDELDVLHTCLQCTDEKKCKYTFRLDDEVHFLCEGTCLNLLLTEQPERFRMKRQSIRVKTMPLKSEETVAPVKAAEPRKSKIVARTEEQATAASLDRDRSFLRHCTNCTKQLLLDEHCLQWETMEFCNETCLRTHQMRIGSSCALCQGTVPMQSLGKYCVRFGFELRQFCQSSCLDTYKKGLKVCSYCQRDISKNEELLAPIAGQFKGFCSRACMRTYEGICTTKKQLLTKTCAVCTIQKPLKVEVYIDRKNHYFCSNPCFSAFKFVNNISPDSCGMCKKYFERKSREAFTIYQDEGPKVFCTKICMNIYIIQNRKISPCNWCKVRKYNFDMIQNLTAASSGSSPMMMCSLNCFTMCKMSMNAIAMKKLKCDQCKSLRTPQYHLTMSDASIRNFCTYQCVMSFQSQFSRAPLTLENETNTPAIEAPVPAGLPKRVKAGNNAISVSVTKQMPSKISKQNNVSKQSVPSAQPPKNNLVISSVTSLAPMTRSSRRGGGGAAAAASNLDLQSFSGISLQPVVALEPLPADLLEKTLGSISRSRPMSRQDDYDDGPPSPPRSPSPVAPPRIETRTQIVTVPPLPKPVANMSTQCGPIKQNKEIQCKPSRCTVGCQTDSFLERKMVIPIPVPIYVPQPCVMYAQPVVTPVPIPLPIPIPIFVPTTRNSAAGIMKEIKKIHDKMPSDPFEAELLMMAEMVAGDKKKEDTDSGTDDEGGAPDYQPEEIPVNNFGEDMLQIAFKMASEYDDPAVDLESAMTANTITNNPELDMHHHHLMMMDQNQGRQMQTRKRGLPARIAQATRQPSKRARRGQQAEIIPPPQPEPPREPIEKADANMCLKYTFGVNAWKQWVMTKNAELEKSTLRRKPFKSDLLQMTADELNYSLCLFVKEVRKPNGSEYAPDTIYYLVLGVQQYLYENNRIDNIFTDPYYEKFTDCLDEVAKKFSVLYNDSQYIVTRVEEEHLWECKQLGAHSPHVLLSTLMFFNTKHFNLTTVEEHMQLSFSHIMKHWKRNPNQGSAKMTGSRNVLLRFYPPQAIDSTSRKKKVYEQQENEENPLRCPVKLYEFYLSKCPESVKTRNDVFYLQPERSCVPDSPVWYSTQALGKEALSKMLHRVKMVKEINIALLTS